MTDQQMIDAFITEMEKEGDYLLLHDYFIVGVDYSDEENLDDGLADAVEAFFNNHHYKDYDRVGDVLLNSFLARDAYYKMMRRKGLLTEEERCVVSHLNQTEENK